MALDILKFTIGVDVWSGDDDPGWRILKDNGVMYALLRMNISDGSLVLDGQFHNWAAARGEGLALAAYVVISNSLGLSVIQYVDWILAHLPADCRVIGLDVEIKGGTALGYSKLVSGILTALQASGLKVLLYSGAWFWSLMAPWPTQFDQWWARYPNAMQPYPPERVTWDQLRAKLANLDGFAPLGSYLMEPGHVAIWQLSSAHILPGGPANWPIDVNLMPLADFTRIWGQLERTREEKLDRLWEGHPELW